MPRTARMEITESKRKKKKLEGLAQQLEDAMILVLILLLILCCYYFWIAFHNVDLNFNMLRVTDTLNSANLYDINGSRVTLDFSNIYDTGSDFVARPLTQYYIASLNNLSVYFILGMLDTLALGFLLARRLKNK